MCTLMFVNNQKFHNSTGIQVIAYVYVQCTQRRQMFTYCTSMFVTNQNSHYCIVSHRLFILCIFFGRTVIRLYKCTLMGVLSDIILSLFQNYSMNFAVKYVNWNLSINSSSGSVYDVEVIPGDPHSFLSCGEDGTIRYCTVNYKLLK